MRLTKIRAWLRKLIPGEDVFAAMGQALSIGAWALLALTIPFVVVEAFSLYAALGLVVVTTILLLSAALIVAVVQLIRQMEKGFLAGLALYAVVASALIASGADSAGWVAVAVLGLGVSVLGASAAFFRRGRGKHRGVIALAVGLVIAISWVAAYFLPSWPTEQQTFDLQHSYQPLNLPDPSEPGPFAYDVLHYGSGDNPQRPEFGAEVDLETERVDGSALIDGWSGRRAWGRTQYWDVTSDQLPVNGKAWIPHGDGPFPVVLIVHGNHAMEDYSDTGYDYLGELFASRGIITASVDQNFLNSSLADLIGVPDAGLDEENDARGWLLLKHLTQFRTWNDQAGHLLQGKFDLSRVVLIGHSRGGEAVSEAAVFNALPAYPDDALLPFDFNFGIRGIIAIAPVDRQYSPRSDQTRLRDVNYLVIHGSHDGDVTSYSGYATLSRASFPTCAHCFKAGYYLVGANHGQFNTAWGAQDLPTPLGRWLNLEELLSGEHQRQVAELLFSAFLQATVFDDNRYKAILAEPYRASSLPEHTVLLNQYSSATEQVVADYFEDDNVETTSLPGPTIRAQNLSVWREQHLKLKWHKTDTAAAIIGWDRSTIDDEDGLPEYTFDGLDDLLSARSAIILSLAALNEAPSDTGNYEPPATVTFSLRLEDAAGQVGTIPIDTKRALTKQVEPNVYKLHPLHDNRTEVVFQTFQLEMARWTEENPQLDLANIRSLTLVFEGTEAAVIALERLGIARAGS